MTKSTQYRGMCKTKDYSYMVLISGIHLVTTGTYNSTIITIAISDSIIHICQRN